MMSNNLNQLIRNLVTFSLFLGLAILSVSCNLPGIASSSARGPRAWIDKPLDGTTLPIGPVEVISHGSDSNGIAEMVLLVNGESVRTDANIADTQLVTFNQIWEPSQAGTYTLEVLARNNAGEENRSKPVTITIGEQTEAPITEITPTATETMIVSQTPTEPPTPSATPGEKACTDLVGFGGETIPDNTVFKPGASFTKSWTLNNAGTCTWTTQYYLFFLDGNSMDAPATVPLPRQVAPGDSITLNVNLTAPNQAGEHRGTWMLSNAENELFGMGDAGDVGFWVQIVVHSATATPTPTTAPSSPQAPSNLQITNSVCSGAGLNVTLSWADNANNETGYRIYRDGTLIQTLGSNTTTYDDNAPNKNSAYTYAVEAYNGVGSSSQATVNSQICPIP